MNPAVMDVSTFNELPADQAMTAITQCCAAHRWAEALVAARPFPNFKALLDAADAYWLDMDETDYLEAFTAHPQIGNVETLRAKFADTKTLAAGEQALVNESDERVLEALAQANHTYLEKFGFIFIVFATGKTAPEMLSILNQRLTNERAEELANAAVEQHKITTLRLKKKFAQKPTAEEHQ